MLKGGGLGERYWSRGKGMLSSSVELGERNSFWILASPVGVCAIVPIDDEHISLNDECKVVLVVSKLGRRGRYLGQGR